MSAGPRALSLDMPSIIDGSGSCTAITIDESIATPAMHPFLDRTPRRRHDETNKPTKKRQKNDAPLASPASSHIRILDASHLSIVFNSGLALFSAIGAAQAFSLDRVANPNSMSKPEAEKNKTAAIKVEAMGSCMIHQMREKQRDDPSSG